MLASETFIKLIADQKVVFTNNKINLFCISGRVAKPLQEEKFRCIYISAQPNEEAIINAIQKNHI